jgi:hypothetical protein
VNPFRGRTVALLCIVAGVSLTAALLWWVFGSELAPWRSAGPDTFSRSAVGHRALLELLREMEVPTVVSRFNSGARARESALLVIAEPWLDTRERVRLLERMVAQAQHVLLVLPKWRGVESEDDPAFIQSAALIDPSDLNEVLRAIGASAEVTRLPGPPGRWQASEFDAAPSIPQPQVINGPGVRPILRCREGSLLAVVDIGRGRRVTVLSDPDLISTHGLVRPGNAVVTMAILDRARSGRGVVVFDETLHGWSKEPSLSRSFFEMPLGLASIQALLAAAVLLWAAMGRFGAPQPVPPPIEAGKKTLIGNIAALLALGGHGEHALKRYFEGAVAEVRAALHVPATMKAADAEARLDAGRARARLRELRELVNVEGRGDRRHVLATALRIHRWREEMIRGRVASS